MSYDVLYEPRRCLNLESHIFFCDFPSLPRCVVGIGMVIIPPATKMAKWVGVTFGLAARLPHPKKGMHT